MKNIDRFKSTKNASGNTTWYFQAFRTTRRGFSTKREAQLAYLELEKIHRKKKKLTGSSSTFIEVAEAWFESYKSFGEQKESTYDKRYEYVVTMSRWIGEKKISSLDGGFLETFFFDLKDNGIDGVSKGYSKNSLEGFRQTLNMIFKYCVNQDILSFNPLEQVRRPKYKKTVKDLKQSLDAIDQKYLTLEELKLLLNYSIIHEELSMSVLFHVLFYTGCRVSEALALQPEDIDFNNNEILFYKQTAVKGKQVDFRIETTKTESSARRVVVTSLVMNKLQELIEALKELREQFKFKLDETYLFVYLAHGKRGIPFRREYVNDHIKKCVHLCGIDKPFHTHLARHTMTSLVADHCTLDVLKARLGHADKTTTMIYRHLTSEERLQPLKAFETLEG